MPTAATIEVIAEPSRRRILDELLAGEQPVNSLVERLGMTQPLVSKHLRILRDAGLVTVRPDGQRRLYCLRPQPLMELDEWLEPYRQMWRASLDRLERHLEHSQPGGRRREGIDSVECRQPPGAALRTASGQAGRRGLAGGDRSR